MQKFYLTAIIQREDNGFVSFCPEFDIASQGETVEIAKANLKEAVELFYECASSSEIERRYVNESYVSSLEVVIG